ncbi:MAG: hypothetical protein ACREIC_19755, partial [Limisphaerales bacterium]
ALSGGVGGNHGYLGSSLSAEWQWISLKVAYMLAGSQFRRVVVQTPIVSENDRENILLTLHPKRFLTLTAGRFNFLQSAQDSVPVPRAVVNQYSANVTADHFVLTGSLFRSYVQSVMTQGTAFSVGRSFARKFQATASLYHSRSGRNTSTTSLLAMLRENLSPRISLLEFGQSGQWAPYHFFRWRFRLQYDLLWAELSDHLRSLSNREPVQAGARPEREFSSFWECLGQHRKPYRAGWLG